ncbi:phosphatase domain-containing putative toxin [Stenotrophomonas sp. JC08]|uniref:phosphatase domain-containing putative toxin n=1 Tax=Stenotrophomonas sp. JC08 TaxID=3445779 RepID=UPI003FA26CB5
MNQTVPTTDGHALTAGSLRIEFSSWSLHLGRRTILTDLDLHLGAPGVMVLMGPAGTGKSTLLKTLAGQTSTHAQYDGTLLVDGQPLERAPRLPALVQQHPRELAMNVLDALIEALRGGQPLTPACLRGRARQALQTFGQHDLLQSLDRSLFNLPRDQMRRALIMRAALSGSPVLLIDEPTSGLDDAQAAGVLDLIRELARNHCCVLVLHHQAQARTIADRVVLLAGGRIQVDTDNAAFFANRADHPVLAQFLRTGSCHVPSPGTLPGELDVAYSAPDAASHMAADELEPLSPSEEPADAHAGEPVATDGLSSRDAWPLPLPPGVLPASRGPNGFHWLIPGKLAGHPMPGAMLPIEHDLGLLRDVGITLLINLTEKPMTQAMIPARGLRTVHMSVKDGNAPPLMWMKMLLTQIERFMRQGEVVGVHCLAGLGRTGTVLGAWLVREGLTADEALRRLRVIEPGFVQSQVQEELLHELEINLLIRASDF